MLQRRPAGPPPEPNANQSEIVTAPDVDYFALASILIEQYGTAARAHAAWLAQDASRERDSVAAEDWHTVGHAIALLTDESAHPKN
jgi:hypothetical protein